MPSEIILWFVMAGINKHWSVWTDLDSAKKDAKSRVSECTCKAYWATNIGGRLGLYSEDGAIMHIEIAKFNASLHEVIQRD